MELFTERPMLEISTECTERIVEHTYISENSIFQDISILDFLEYAEFQKDLGKGTSAVTSLYLFDNKHYVVRFVSDVGKQELANEIAIYKTLIKNNSTYCFNLLYADKSTDHYSPSYFVFAYEEGMTLQEYLEENSSISVQFTHYLGHHLETAVRELHNYGIMHRDIKPTNIFLRKETWIPKLFDFSDAVCADKMVIPSPQIEFTGSPKYSHPAIRNLQYSFSPVPFRMEYDMYAIGVILRDDIAPRVRRFSDKQDVLAMANYFFDSAQWI
jgi:serine/threonine protein kinase